MTKTSLTFQTKLVWTMGVTLRAIINSSQENDIVLDPFAGSGSTLIAAHNQNRVCYSMEISPAYCQVILDRFEEHTGIMTERLSSSQQRRNLQEIEMRSVI